MIEKCAEWDRVEAVPSAKEGTAPLGAVFTAGVTCVNDDDMDFQKCWRCRDLGPRTFDDVARADLR